MPPQILENCVKDVMREQKLPKSRAFAICTASQQKAGILKAGSSELTEKGKKRQAVLSATRRQ